MQVVGVLFLVVLLGSLGVKVAECRVGATGLNELEYSAINCRKHSAVLTDFGGVGDGKTSNTKAFQYAIGNLSQYGNDGGALLVVPPGKWLTGSFNLTSHFTLFLQNDAVILASQVYICHPEPRSSEAEILAIGLIQRPRSLLQRLHCSRRSWTSVFIF